MALRHGQMCKKGVPPPEATKKTSCHSTWEQRENFLLEVICQKKANWTHIFEGHFLKLRIWRLPKLKIPKDVFLTKMKPKTVEHVAPEFWDLWAPEFSTFVQPQIDIWNSCGICLAYELLIPDHNGRANPLRGKVIRWFVWFCSGPMVLELEAFYENHQNMHLPPIIMLQWKMTLL